MTSSSVTSDCAQIELGRPSSTAAAAIAGNSTAQASVDFHSTRTPRRARHNSTTSTMAASATSSHSVPGTLPAPRAAIDSAPKATSSPCGMKITRVTENTSTRASAISA